MRCNLLLVHWWATRQRPPDRVVVFMSFRRKLARRTPASNLPGPMAGRRIYFHPEGVHAQGCEWVGGVLCTDAEDDVSSATAILMAWTRTDGEVLGARMIPIRSTRGIFDHFSDTAEAPWCGLPQGPSQIRVATEEGLALFRGVLGRTINIVLAPTPELEELSRTVRTRTFGDATHSDRLLQAPPLQEVASLVGGLEPWSFLAPETVVLVNIPMLGVVNHALVMWSAPFGPSLLFFRSERMARHYVHVASRDRAGPPPLELPHLAVRFTRTDAVPEPFREDVSSLVSDAQVPWYVHVNGDSTLRALSSAERTMLEAALFAFWGTCHPSSAIEPDLIDGNVVTRADLRVTGGMVMRVALTFPAGPLVDSGRVIVRHLAKVRPIRGPG